MDSSNYSFEVGGDPRRTDYTGADLSNLDYAGAKFINGYFDGANLHNADFASANLTAASLVGAKLTAVNFSNADLSHADLSSADLRGANFSGADISYATMPSNWHEVAWWLSDKPPIGRNTLQPPGVADHELPKERFEIFEFTSGLTLDEGKTDETIVGVAIWDNFTGAPYHRGDNNLVGFSAEKLGVEGAKQKLKPILKKIQESQNLLTDSDGQKQKTRAEYLKDIEKSIDEQRAAKIENTPLSTSRSNREER